MKTVAVLFAALLGAGVFAGEVKDGKITTTCNLSDLGTSYEQVQKYEVAMDKSVRIGTYRGHVYDLSLFNQSYSGKTRYQLIISARDEKSNAVIGSASANFAQEVPELLYQDGANILLNCMQF